MNDLISRQAAIDAMEQAKEQYFDRKVIVGKMQDIVNNLSSAQPEKRTEERTETHACDLQPTCNQLATDTISRQSAIEVIDAVFPVDPMKSEYAQGIACGAALAKTYVEQLPSAQPSGKDPIEREAVVDILHDAMQGCGESEENLIGEIVCKVDLLPSAQPEIIRCRECKHSEHWYRDKARCFLWHEEGIDVFEDGYCSYAERRKE